MMRILTNILSDCLCIIQDSPDDWSHESATMCNIYRNSVLTICALYGSSCHTGLFVTRKPLQLRHCRIREYDPTTNRSALYVYSHANPAEREWQGTGEDGLPLQRRAWVLTERLLSPRSLYFGPKTISWECVQLDATETRPQGNPIWESTSRSNHESRLKRNFYAQMLLTDISNEVKFLKAWDHIVETYTSCALTYGKDKLPALHGVIRNIEQNSSLGYRSVAGIWTHNLPHYLLWYTMCRKPKPEKWRAPSWSWAAVDDVVHHRLSRITVPKFEAVVEDMNISVHGVKENGELTKEDACILKFRAPMKMVYWNCVKYQQTRCPIIWNMDFRDVGGPKTVACALIARRLECKDGENRERREDLALVLIKDDGDGHWRRIGFFYQVVWDKGEDDALFPYEEEYVKAEITVV